MKNVKDEIDTIADVRMYSRPESLKKRTDGYAEMKKTFEPNEWVALFTLLFLKYFLVKSRLQNDFKKVLPELVLERRKIAQLKKN